MKPILVMIVLLMFVSQTNPSKIRCEFEGPAFVAKHLDFNGKYTLTNTIYDDVNVFVDTQDGTVSKDIAHNGFW